MTQTRISFRYKCRLCGAAYPSISIGGGHSNPSATMLFDSIRGRKLPEPSKNFLKEIWESMFPQEHRESPDVKMNDVHACTNGDYGISDLQGAVRKPIE